MDPIFQVSSPFVHLYLRLSHSVPFGSIIHDKTFLWKISKMTEYGHCNEVAMSNHYKC